MNSVHYLTRRKVAFRLALAEKDENVGHTKYCNFRGQFDVQVFSSMEFLENNGRGGLSSGKCEQAK